MGERTLVVFANIGRDELIPPAAEAVLGRSGSARRIQETYAFAILNLVEGEVRARLSGLGFDVAIGPREVWERYPDLRGDFAPQIIRQRYTGDYSGLLRISETIVGDILVSEGMMFMPTPFEMELADREACFLSIKYDEIYKVDKYLSIGSPGISYDLNGCWIYLVSDLSIEVGVRNLPLNILFLSARQMMRDTNFVYILQKIKSAYSGSELVPHVPENFSGAFVVPASAPHPSDYQDAIISRIMASIVATTPVSGRVLLQLYFNEGAEVMNFNYQPRMYEPWGMPFRAWPVLSRCTVVDSDNIFWKSMDTLSGTTEARFRSAKEDYRALALETAADGRYTSAAAMQFTQIWMAIERLLPFRHETTIQLTLALTALVPAEKRSDEFDSLKDLYAVRSKVAHGYAFARDEDMYEKIRKVGSIFRKLFSISLKFETSSDLRESLLNHVLAGRPESFEGFPVAL